MLVQLTVIAKRRIKGFDSEQALESYYVLLQGSALSNVWCGVVFNLTDAQVASDSFFPNKQLRCKFLHFP